VCSHPVTIEHINSLSLSCQEYFTLFIFRWIWSIKERRPEERAYSITGREKEFSLGWASSSSSRIAPLHPTWIMGFMEDEQKDSSLASYLYEPRLFAQNLGDNIRTG